MEIKNLLREEIQNELIDLKTMERGSEEYKTTVDSVAKLADRVIDIEKVDLERQSKAKEDDLKLKQMEDDQKDRFIRNCIAAAGIVIPVVVTVWGTVKSFEFERDGTITTIIGRGFINKLLPKK